MVDTVQEQISSIGGLGFASLDPENVVDIQGIRAPEAAAPAQRQQLQAPQEEQVPPTGEVPPGEEVPPPPGTERPSVIPRMPERLGFKQRFKENPLGTLGVIFSSIAEGFRGQPISVAQAATSRQQGIDSKAKIFNNALDIVGKANVAIENAAPENVEDIKAAAKEIIGSIFGDFEAGDAFVEQLSLNPIDATKIFELNGMGETIVEMGLDDLPPSELLDIFFDPVKFEGIKMFHDRRHRGVATDKLNFLMDTFRQIRNSDALNGIPGVTGSARDDVGAILDAGNNITVSQEEFLDNLQGDPNFRINGEPIFTPAEMASLRNNPDIVEAITGAKSARATIVAREADLRSPKGKEFQDLLDVENQFGPDSVQATAFRELLEEPVSLTDIGAFRQQFTNLSKDFIKIRDAFVKVEAAASTAAGDLALIFGFMKILDPTSVVREGEQATAANARGVPAALRQQFNRILAGEKLDVSQRIDFKERAQELFDTQLVRQIQLEDNFRSIAGLSDINPDQVLVDFIGNLRVKEIPKPDIVLE